MTDLFCEFAVVSFWFADMNTCHTVQIAYCFAVVDTHMCFSMHYEIVNIATLI